MLCVRMLSLFECDNKYTSQRGHPIRQGMASPEPHQSATKAAAVLTTIWPIKANARCTTDFGSMRDIFWDALTVWLVG